ncbi:MAG TPA: flagellar motor switch protein FliG [Candidatus Competibacter sp.]|nr:flagellar motor switch protein FliG [Candidatus Competibacter sp.]MCC9004048.1 flagellar motor switch protein FliG [Candidatus Competibacter sp.]HRF62071.1 flagellar motor switch protein FliG [Candidatus Competibacter sp.]HRX62459.1 flagellar motor switch protein FliG [Candidatus Competibacter sp.]HUM90527.1 flagellar motor switch protein FliG [Candidatus Competibacter sp.]
MSELTTAFKGVDRAAVVLMALGESHAAEILRHLDPHELHKLGVAMANLANVNRDQLSEIVHAFNEEVDSQTSLISDGENYIRGVLTRALGREKARNILEHIFSGEDQSGVDSLKWMDAGAIAGGLREEHPQVVALVLSSLPPEQAASVVNLLPSPLRDEALLRVAILDEIPAGALAELNELIEKQVMRNINAAATSKIGGPKRAAEILGRLDAAVEGSILDKIKEVDADLGGKIEDLMVVFDNLIGLSDRDVQALLREVASDKLLVALRGADEAVRQKIMGNMSKRAAELLRDDLEAMPPVKLSDVEAAQKEIMATAKRLAEAGEITLSGKGEQLV